MRLSAKETVTTPLLTQPARGSSADCDQFELKQNHSTKLSREDVGDLDFCLTLKNFHVGRTVGKVRSIASEKLSVTAFRMVTSRVPEKSLD